MESAEATPTAEEQLSVSREIAEKILEQSILQLSTSRRNKRQRMEEIKENEDLYHNIITEKSIRNPFNECFPFMAGFVDHMKAKIDDDSNLSYRHQAEADFKKTQKIQGFYDETSKSVTPNNCWDLKHRHAKTNALFSGVAIYKYFSTGKPYKSYLEVISHYDFHCEPRGGAIIENHLFCGQDNIFKTEEDLTGNKSYSATQVAKLVKAYQDNGWKDNNDHDSLRNNRAHALGQQPETNNYVGQGVIKLVEWYTTYKGERYYMLFNEQSRTWIRCMKLTDMFEDNTWPYVVWHTNEDPDVFWSKAPCDDARAVAKIINTMVNQELYNRQKRNYGQRAYDVMMFPNVAALADWRPDGLVPVDVGQGKNIANGVYEFKVGDLSGTLDLVTWLEQFTGKQVGYTSSGAGQSENDKKVGVFQGEIEQIDQLINIKNKSYRLALSILGLKFKRGLVHMDDKMSVQVMGGKGIEWQEFTKEDIKLERDPSIIPVGGVSELRLKELEKSRKRAALVATQTTNPQQKDRHLLLLSDWSEQDVRELFSDETLADKELMSEAAQSEKDIVEGKEPKLNRGATAAFMQHIIDFATNTDDLPLPTYQKLMAYAMQHTDIALENMNRNVKEMLAQRARLTLSTPLPPGSAMMEANGSSGLQARPRPIAGEMGGGGESGGIIPSRDGSEFAVRGERDALPTGV